MDQNDKMRNALLDLLHCRVKVTQAENYQVSANEDLRKAEKG